MDRDGHPAWTYPNSTMRPTTPGTHWHRPLWSSAATTRNRPSQQPPRPCADSTHCVGPGTTNSYQASGLRRRFRRTARLGVDRDWRAPLPASCCTQIAHHQHATPACRSGQEWDLTRIDTPALSTRLESRTVSRALLRCLYLLGAGGGRCRAQRSALGNATPVPPGTRPSRHLDHVPHQIASDFTLVEDQGSSKLSRHRGPQFLPPERRHPILHNNQPGR